MFRIVERRYWFFLLSALVLVPGIVALFLWGVPRSIDFTGGTIYEVAFEDPSRVSETGMREVFTANGFGEVQVVETHPSGTEKRVFQVRSATVDPAQKEILAGAMAERFGPFEERSFDSVGGSVGSEVSRRAAIAVAMAALVIAVYLTAMFRNVPHPVRYGVCAIIAMLHDILVVMGLAAIMGHFRHWEVDALFLTAVLTVIGFSVHDTIVVFDRIRENVGRLRGLRFEAVVNHSITQTLDRSILTGLSGLFALVAIFIYTDGQLQRFVFWLFIGIVSGSYSSIFNAVPLLVVWENREWRHWFGRGGAEAASA